MSCQVLSQRNQAANPDTDCCPVVKETYRFLQHGKDPASKP